MKKTWILMAVLVMALGNTSFAQHKTNLKTKATQTAFKHFGVRDESTVVPQTALCTSADGGLMRTTYIYDEYDYYLIEELEETNEDGIWYPEYRYTYDYDFSGNLLEMLLQWNDGDDWADEARATFEYDGDDLAQVVYQYWDGDDWMNEMKEVYTYVGDVMTVLFWEWNGTTWSSSELYTYTYSATTIEVLMQYMQGGAWQNEEKDLYTLDFDGNVIEILQQDWASTTWTNVYKTTYGFEGSVFTSKLREDWDGSAWVDGQKFEYVYTAGNAVKGECMAASGNGWEPADGDIEMAYGYNAANKEYYCWQVEIEYVDLTGIGENATPVAFTVYPTPATDEVTIAAAAFDRAEVYNLTGQKLMESRMAQMSVATLAPGLYIIKVYDLEGRSAAQRLVVR